MKKDTIHIEKRSGERALFSEEKLLQSLLNAGADAILSRTILDRVKEELYDGISSKEIYNRAFSLLKGKRSYLASRYKLKKAIYELGPTGFPFEKFISKLLSFSGYQVSTNVILPGNCVNHEIDVVAEKSNTITLVECKYHSEQGLKCNVKIPLYIQSRYVDVKGTFYTDSNNQLGNAWVVTNTKFTKDAVQYGSCVGLYLLSWNYPENDGLKDRIDRLGLYPITVSTLLTEREKQFLLNRDIILCSDLIDDNFYLDKLEVGVNRKKKILDEINQLCKR